MPIQLQQRTPAEPREWQITGRFVLFAMIGFFAVIIAVNATMARLAISTFGGVETESAYKAGLEFGRDAEAARAQEALGWKVEGVVRRSEDGAVLVEVEARDAAGYALDGLVVGVELHHPADARRDLKLAALPSDRGRYVATGDIGAGRWTLGIDIARDGKPAFRSSSRVSIP